MGVQSRIVVAAEDEAPALLASDEPTYRWECVTINGFHNIHLETLFSALCHYGLETPAVDKIVEQIKDAGDCNSANSLFRVADAVRDVYAEIAGMDDDQVAALSHRWAEVPEWEGWDIEIVEAAARTIGDLADTAKWSDQALWLWMSH